MKRRHLIGRVAAVVALVAGAAVASTLPAGADVSVMSPPVAGLQIGSPATLLARGAAVSVPITVLCAPGGEGFLQVEVTERSGGNVATGFAFVDGITCTGTFQTINVVVTASGEPFRHGTALVSARFVVCDFGCLEATAQQEVKVTR
jgi:hypothetical protein